MEKNKIISIFSGIDCLGLGFRKDFDILLAVEKEKNACETLRKNKEKFHPNLREVWNENIYEISNERIFQLKKWGIDGIIGGPPCQAYSTAKGKFDPNDERTRGIFEYLRWVKILNPKFVMLENVFGLLQGAKRAFYDFFKKELESLGYNVKEKILNAHDYGSVQSRLRLIVVGFRLDTGLSFIYPNPVKEENKKYVRDILKDEPLGECMQYSKSRAEIASYVPEGGNWRNLPTEELIKKALGGNYEKREGGMTGVYRRLSRNKPCPTLTTNPNQRNTMAIHPTKVRPLSVAEYKRAQGIPEDYQIVGTVSQKYLYIGNGVPVELAMSISNQIKKILLSNVSNISNNQKKSNVNIIKDNKKDKNIKDYLNSNKGSQISFFDIYKIS